MANMKYIITSHHSPILFSEAESHSDIARGHSPISAGFVNVSVDNGYPDDNVGEGELKVYCYGSSTTLNGLQSRPEKDAELIKAMILRY
jgi:hypothetical protein